MHAQENELLCSRLEAAAWDPLADAVQAQLQSLLSDKSRLTQSNVRLAAEVAALQVRARSVFDAEFCFIAILH